jgi:hypothetical protein
MVGGVGSSLNQINCVIDIGHRVVLIVRSRYSIDHSAIEIIRHIRREGAGEQGVPYQ